MIARVGYIDTTSRNFGIAKIAYTNTSASGAVLNLKQTGYFNNATSGYLHALVIIKEPVCPTEVVPYQSL